ncbi:hypothetical protein NM688_g5248 [Phlebia brevispora]|uniref:Uncharacterized protein n=1 Tax=Phlebia brevispora TaxID=194682 RepID=A0ACC1SYE1_9APHY|nr:hypothetical protein NM688_g5248 [Phlebia brevispora]
MATAWRELVRDKRARQVESIPKEWLIDCPAEAVLDVTKIPKQCGLFTAKELEITGTTDAALLLSKLASGEWSSVEVTTAFYKRAIVAHQLVNCLTEIFVERALARAAELDAHLKSTGKVVGPLHGLPISLKDQLPLKGLETTMGYVSWIGKFAERNAVVVDILYDLGAVPFVRTNVPQTLMWAETYNNVFGRTLNPHNRSLTSGGSSGGEGALVGMRGSPLGIGSDIGGSIRIPSVFNGLYGLRPSYGRVPYAHAVNSMEGQDSILSVLGPLSSSLSGVKIFMKSIAENRPWLRDPLARRKKWDDEEYALVEHGGGKNLCFGIIWNDGQVVPHPPVIRALEMTKAALIAAGHKGAADDYRAVTSSTGEPIINSMEIVDEENGVVKNTFLPPMPASAYHLWQFQKERRDLRQEYLEYWNSTVEQTGTGRPVDAIIAPCAPYTAVPHGKNNNAAYTAVWNALDYPACVFPVTRVDPVLDAPRPRHDFIDDTDKAIHELYKPETFVNAPVGLQLVGRCQEEEAVIAMTEVVDAALKEAKAKIAKL